MKIKVKNTHQYKNQIHIWQELYICYIINGILTTKTNTTALYIKLLYITNFLRKLEK